MQYPFMGYARAMGTGRMTSDVNKIPLKVTTVIEIALHALQNDLNKYLVNVISVKSLSFLLSHPHVEKVRRTRYHTQFPCRGTQTRKSAVTW